MSSGFLLILLYSKGSAQYTYVAYMQMYMYTIQVYTVEPLWTDFFHHLTKLIVQINLLCKWNFEGFIIYTIMNVLHLAMKSVIGNWPA